MQSIRVLVSASAVPARAGVSSLEESREGRHVTAEAGPVESAYLHQALAPVGRRDVAFLRPAGLLPQPDGPVSNVLPSACVGLAFWSSLQCTRRYGTGLRKRFQATWVMFSLGTGLWLLAEMTWAFYYFVLSVSVPYPSTADVFYLGGYIPMLLGLTLYLGAFFQGMTRQRLVSALSLIVISGLVVVLLVIPPELLISETIAQRITDVSYPVLDLSLLSVTILSPRSSSGLPSRWLLIFGEAAIAYVIADGFLYQIAAGTTTTGASTTHLRVGILLFVPAFYEHRRRF